MVKELVVANMADVEDEDSCVKDEVLIIQPTSVSKDNSYQPMNTRQSSWEAQPHPDENPPSSQSRPGNGTASFNTHSMISSCGHNEPLFQGASEPIPSWERPSPQLNGPKADHCLIDSGGTYHFFGLYRALRLLNTLTNNLSSVPLDFHLSSAQDSSNFHLMEIDSSKCITLHNFCQHSACWNEIWSLLCPIDLWATGRIQRKYMQHSSFHGQWVCLEKHHYRRTLFRQDVEQRFECIINTFKGRTFVFSPFISGKSHLVSRQLIHGMAQEARSHQSWSTLWSYGALPFSSVHQPENNFRHIFPYCMISKEKQAPITPSNQRSIHLLELIYLDLLWRMITTSIGGLVRLWNNWWLYHLLLHLHFSEEKPTVRSSM